MGDGDAMKTIEELFELALENQKLAHENHRLAVANQKIIATVQVKMAEAQRDLLKVVENQSTRLDRIETV